MGLDLNAITLKIDPGNSAAKLQEFVTGLTRAEQTGKQAGQSMLGVSAAFKAVAQAMQQEQAALERNAAMHEKLAVSNSALVTGFGKVAEQIAREKAMLDQILAPQQEYFDKLTALDKLLERNAITTKQYAEQVTKLNAAIGETPPPPAAPSAPGAGLASLGQAAFAAGGAGIAVLGVGRQIEDVVHNYEQLDDTYTNLYNHALKFADGTHSVGAVLSQQEALAADLHSTLAQSMDVYDSVGDALVDLNLKERQLVAATKAVGEEAVISGKSMSSAGDVLNRLVLAMDSGAGAGRALKTALVGYDAISDTLTSHFHTTRAGLIEMVNAQKVGTKDIVEALIQESAGIQEQYDKRKLTYEQEKAIIDEKVALYRKDTDEMSAVFEAGNPKLRAFDMSMRAWGGTLDDDSRATRFITDEVRAFGEQLDEVKNKTNHAVREGFAGVSSAAVTVGRGLEAIVGHYDELAKHLGIVDPWKVQTEAAKKYADQLGDVRRLLDGMIDAANRVPKPSGTNHAEAIATGDADYAVNSVAPLTQTAAAAEHYRLELAQLNDMIERNVVDQDQAAARLKMINAEYLKGVGAVDANVQRQHELQAMLDAIKKPQEDYARDLELVKQLYANGSINAQEYADKVAAIRDAYSQTQKHSTDFATGLEHGWNDIVKEATDSAGQIETAMKGAFGAIEDSLTNMVMKGQFDLSSLGSQLEQILVKLAVQQATGGIIGAIGGGRTGFDYMTPGGSGPVFPGFATGGDMLVGGSGGPDSKLAMFHVSPGETIHVRTPQQRADMADSAGRGGGVTHNHFYTYDPKALNKDIRSAIGNELQQNRARYRSLLGV